MPIDLSSLEQQKVIELFALSEFDTIGTIFRFTAYREVMWQGHQWLHLDCKSEGFEANSRQLSSPKIIVSNILGYMGQLIEEYNDLENAKIIRYRTIESLLLANSADLIAIEPYRIEQKSDENEKNISFELTPLAIENRKLPRGTYETKYCPLIYRGTECGFTAPPLSTPDICNKTWSDCAARFGNNPLPIRIFPGAQIE
jgi:lambda family phage minor tail protein L